MEAKWRAVRFSFLVLLLSLLPRLAFPGLLRIVWVYFYLHKNKHK